MTRMLLGLISAVIGGIIVAIFREVMIVKKDKNKGKQIAKVVLKNELNKIHKYIIEKNNHNKSIDDYIREVSDYGHDKDIFITPAWDSTKMEIARLNSDLSLKLYMVYSFYEKLRQAKGTSEIEVEELNSYHRNYENLLNDI